MPHRRQLVLKEQVVRLKALKEPTPREERLIIEAPLADHQVRTSFLRRFIKHSLKT